MNELNCPGIYRFTCIPNGKVYVGRSINVYRRILEHRQQAKTKNIPLYYAVRKYGWENFQVDLLERVDDPDQLIPREQFWIDALRAAERGCGYNLCPRGDGPQGFKHGPEMRAKMAASKGEKRPPVSVEARKRMSETAQAYWKDRPRKVKPPKPPKPPKKIKSAPATFGSDEHRAKMSAAQKLRTDRQTPEYRAKMREAQLKRWADRPAKPPKLSPAKAQVRMREAKRVNDQRRKEERLTAFNDFLATRHNPTVAQVADFFAVSVGTAYRLMKEACYKHNRAKQSDHVAQAIYAGVTQYPHATLKEIASACHTSASTVSYWLNAAGYMKKHDKWQLP